MAISKKTFILNFNWIDSINKLTDNEAGKLFKCILKFVNNEYCDVNDEIKELYNTITQQIVYDFSKHNPKTNKYHWNFKGGITPENKIIRNSQKMSYWRNNVFERDNYTCQKCFNVGGKLNAHHIKHFSKHIELRFDVNNGITLCLNCHKEIHRNNGKY